jgi:hypothetical protein
MALVKPLHIHKLFLVHAATARSILGLYYVPNFM